MAREPDWISASSSLVAAVVALITLLTVYLALIQILQRNQMHRLGISTKSLGPWKGKVEPRFPLLFQTQIPTPTLSLPRLVQKGWEPEITFPIGFEIKSKGANPDPDPEPGQVLAEASWVNFLQALDLDPYESTKFYQMRYQSELVNGIVPVRWKGRDLVGICSMLGFQAPESKGDAPIFRTPMALPMQWSGPLGWLQFRSSSDGCIAEFRRRSVIKNQLRKSLHDYYQSLDVTARPFNLVSRLWQSINGLVLPENELLYLGGSDKMTEQKRSRGDLMGQQETDFICDELLEMNHDPTDEEIRTMLFGRKSNRPEALRPEAFEKGPSQLSQSDLDHNMAKLLKGLDLDDSLTGCSKSGGLTKYAVMSPCPGLLSVIVEGDLADSRGLTYKHCHEFSTVFVDEDEVDRKTHPYRLGRFCMGLELLDLVKQAFLLLEPDGFYFSPSMHVTIDVSQIFSTVDDQSDNLPEVIPAVSLDNWKDANWRVDSTENQLYNAMVLCNEFQRIKNTSRVMLTIEDMRLISKASVSLRKIISPRGNESKDLIWAMIICSDLLANLVERFKSVGVQDIIKAEVTFEKGEANIAKISPRPDPDRIDQFKVPLIGDSKFTGAQVLAAYLDVFLTYFWLESSWVSNVAMYDTTIPQSVTMC